MTDRTHPEAGSTHIIRFALELGLLWIDGSGRDKVREALDALDALEAKLASIGAGGGQALSAAPANPLTISALEEQQMFDDWCPYRGNPDPRTVWAAAIEAVNGMQLCAASPTPPAEQHTDDIAVDCFARALKAKLAAARAKGRGGWDTPECTQQRLSNMLREHVDKGDPRDVANFCMFLWARGEAISPPAEQQAQPGAVYAELPDPAHRGPCGTGSYFDSFTRDQMRDFADRTHALRMEQAAPKAAPAWEHHARKLTQWLHCMSHNDSYFGEPAGLVKQVTGELNRLIGAAPQQEAQEPVALLVRKNSWHAGQWEAAPPGSPSYGLAWADQRQYVYAAPQPAPDCHHRPPCEECAARARLGEKT